MKQIEAALHSIETCSQRLIKWDTAMCEDMTKCWVELVGWIGSFLILGCYLAISMGKVKGNSFWYQMFNILGAICLIINTYYNRALPATFLNAVWALIGVVTLIKAKKEAQSSPNS
ncbi:CBU_0592 family membrane protein [Pontibacter sp. G13]|uniref:CBU_0592 family membrane protein n=1 Tax=Pontibacter sp. G13 TaxID=3074898 RepID=UPI00288BEDEF|nr:hypothetical protein [Pontibacter sp. G13]WNJ21139.1 hypothetical protein RJD25_11785 [Pontibacter sp. G13]